MKQFGKKHSDSVGNIKIASYEGKQFATAVQEAKQMLLRVLENGSKKQIFISQYKVRHQMLDHVDRLFDLNIWDGVHDYNQHDADFLRQVCENQHFQDVSLLKMPPDTLETLSDFADQLQNNKILQRRTIMSRKDWMKIEFEKLSESELETNTYYGVFVEYTKVLLSMKNSLSP